MPKGMPKKIGEDQLLEGGGGGGGGVRGSTRERVEAMTPKERATLENPGKQFEVLTPMQKTAMEKVRKAQESFSPKERAELEKIGEQFRVKPSEQPKAKREKPNLFEMSDAERAGLTPAQLRKYGSDVTFKKGGSVTKASSRADGIAQRGKTKGRYI